LDQGGESYGFIFNSLTVMSLLAALGIPPCLQSMDADAKILYTWNNYAFVRRSP
jgi:hypothetical protein